MSDAYAYGAGSVDVDTSREREVRNAPADRTRRQQAVDRIRSAGAVGMIRTEVGEPHQTWSAATTGAHKAGEIVRLVKRRHGHHVYVAPEFQDGREVLPYQGNADKAYARGFNAGFLAGLAFAREAE